MFINVWTDKQCRTRSERSILNRVSINCLIISLRFLMHYSTIKPANVISSLRYWIFGENFYLLEGRKNIFLSESRSQFVLTRPAKILKIGH